MCALLVLLWWFFSPLICFVVVSGPAGRFRIFLQLSQCFHCEMELFLRKCINSISRVLTLSDKIIVWFCFVLFSAEAVCIFEGRTYFEGQRETVYSSSGDCVLFECKVRLLMLKKIKILHVRNIKVTLKQAVEIQTGLP